jgi:hypothetical protein
MEFFIITRPTSTCYDHLGDNNVNNKATTLEDEFDTLSYSSETCRWNLEKYVSKHVELYNTAQDLVAYGYSGIDNASRVRKLCKE